MNKSFAKHYINKKMKEDWWKDYIKKRERLKKSFNFYKNIYRSQQKRNCIDYKVKMKLKEIIKELRIEWKDYYFQRQNWFADY